MILLSIKPKYADMILDGNKTVEIRRTNIKWKPNETVLMYATSPISRIVGRFTIQQIVFDNCESIWNTYSDKMGLSKAEFLQYASGKDNVCAILLCDQKPIRNGLSLNKLRSELRINIPQSYIYIRDADIIQYLDNN